MAISNRSGKPFILKLNRWVWRWIAFSFASLSTFCLTSPVMAQDGIFDGIRDPFLEALGDENASITDGVNRFFLLITAIFAFLGVVTLVSGIFQFVQTRDFVTAFAPFLLLVAFAIIVPIVITMFVG